jgi:hypothetical protein
MPVAGGEIRIADGRVSGAGELAADQIATGLAPRDWHLRSSHYLHTAKHRRIRVSVDDVPASATSVPCTVEVRGVSCVATLEVGAVGHAGDVLSVDGRLVFDRSPLPMLPPIAGVSRLVEIDLSIRATRRNQRLRPRCRSPRKAWPCRSGCSSSSADTRNRPEQFRGTTGSPPRSLVKEVPDIIRIRGMRTGPPLDTSQNANFCAARGIPFEEPPDGDAQAG